MVVVDCRLVDVNHVDERDVVVTEVFLVLFYHMVKMLVL